MLLLTRLVGHTVCGPDGRAVGLVADLTVSLGEHSGRTVVDRLLVRRRGAPDLLVPWSAVGSFARDVFRLSADPAGFAIASLTGALDRDELLLKRDVLDTQIVDIRDQRLARVADVVLARTPDGHLQLVGVEVGFGAVLRRLGLTRWAMRGRDDAVAWSDLHLTSERGHSVQLETPRSAVHLLDARALAVLVSRLDTESATELLTARGPAMAADIVRVSHPVVGERVLRALPDATAAQIVAAMPAEHARHWRRRLSSAPAWRGRRFLRSRVWPRRRHRPRTEAGA
ncbi:hypothetical protein Mycch_1186 [Mycolicibacterium chubuense NBB4]|uniref:MgtE intracellular N domain protein n=1 Tax=Mycolicibacterium chubuense (strain NBB4) TaxID=710421 RepID=I4BFD7_MYCCN|nr:magnesium transporter [Mycolicibacterium chubuense]AFM15994.1 hypothetical protein Mycch_1186 [Mycolicibacterium chubuense NBB4]